MTSRLQELTELITRHNTRSRDICLKVTDKSTRVFITSKMKINCSGDADRKKEARQFELIHILLPFIPLVSQEVILES